MKRLKKLKSVLAYNALTNVYENMIAAGIIDPAKVTRSAIQNAASIAAMVLTTEAIVSEKPNPNEACSHGRHGRHGRNGRHGRHDVSHTPNI